MKLDAKTVAALMLPDGKNDVMYFDSELPRFGYRLRRSGDKVLRSWVIQYRNKAGASRRLLLGSAEEFTAARAREAAKDVLARIRLGQDPQGDKSAAHAAEASKKTLAGAVDDFLAVKEREVRSRTLGELTRYLTGTYFKPLHKTAIDAIKLRDISACVTTIERERGQAAAAKAHTAVAGLCSWALGRGLLEANPMSDAKRPKVAPPRERVLKDDELRAIWQHAGDDDFGRIVRLLILTGHRRSEIGGMHAHEFDCPERPTTWTLPAERSKNERAHTIPLGSLAREVLAGAHWERERLFAPRSEGFNHWSLAKRTLDERLGDRVAPWTLHDLRRTFCTRLGDLGVLPHAIEAAVNHRSGFRKGVAGIYNRSAYEAEVRAALALWDSRVSALLAGRPLVERHTDNVIPLRANI
jgi:integrase